MFTRVKELKDRVANLELDVTELEIELAKLRKLILTKEPNFDRRVGKAWTEKRKTQTKKGSK